MKKILLLLVAAFLLNGCRYVNTQEQYVNAKVSPELTIPEGVDKPNTTSTLNIPKAGSQKAAEVSSAPPDMPIRTKQSEDGSKRIENKKGYPVLTIKSDKDNAWSKMLALEIESWSISEKNEDTCNVALTHVDQEAKGREDAGFIKKIFTREKYYSDYSGIYQLQCVVKGSVIDIKFSKQDGSAAKSFLADSIMNKLYDLF